MKNILITICGRGGSKGLPKKNIKTLSNQPLIAYTIKTAQKLFIDNCRFIISLSTDDLEIKKIAEKYNLITDYTRPKVLAEDKSGKVEAIEDLLLFEENSRKIKFDYILDLDISSPLRSIDDIKKSYKLFQKNTKALTLFSVNNAKKNPYFNMVEKNKSGFYNLSKNLDEKILTRQKSPIVYDLNASFYWYRRIFFENKLQSVITNRSLIFEMKHICFDIDDKQDFEYMDYLISNNKIDFDL